jgi:hypothetical protein
MVLEVLGRTKTQIQATLFGPVDQMTTAVHPETSRWIRGKESPAQNENQRV